MRSVPTTGTFTLMPSGQASPGAPVPFDGMEPGDLRRELGHWLDGRRVGASRGLSLDDVPVVTAETTPLQFRTAVVERLLQHRLLVAFVRHLDAQMQAVQESGCERRRAWIALAQELEGEADAPRHGVEGLGHRWRLRGGACSAKYVGDTIRACRRGFWMIDSELHERPIVSLKDGRVSGAQAAGLFALSAAHAFDSAHSLLHLAVALEVLTADHLLRDNARSLAMLLLAVINLIEPDDDDPSPRRAFGKARSSLTRSAGIAKRSTRTNVKGSRGCATAERPDALRKVMLVVLPPAAGDTPDRRLEDLLCAMLGEGTDARASIHVQGDKDQPSLTSCVLQVSADADFYSALNASPTFAASASLPARERLADRIEDPRALGSLEPGAVPVLVIVSESPAPAALPFQGAAQERVSRLVLRLTDEAALSATHANVWPVGTTMLVLDSCGETGIPSVLRVLLSGDEAALLVAACDLRTALSLQRGMNALRSAFALEPRREETPHASCEPWRQAQVVAVLLPASNTRSVGQRFNALMGWPTIHLAVGSTNRLVHFVRLFAVRNKDAVALSRAVGSARPVSAAPLLRDESWASAATGGVGPRNRITELVELLGEVPDDVFATALCRYASGRLPDSGVECH